MPLLKTYNLFISHAWKYDNEYLRLVNLLNSAPNFKWKNYSVPKDDPLAGGSKNKLVQEITNQIRFASVVLIISGIYVAHREWIQYEIDMADTFDKSIIAIRPWGSVNIPTAVQRTDIELVGWNSSSIVDAIRRNAP